MRFRFSVASAASLAIVATACAGPSPLAAQTTQTTRDTLTRVKTAVDSSLVHDRRLCKTSNRQAYLCRDTVQLKSASADLARMLSGVTPIPTPIPTPTPTPVPSDSTSPELPRYFINSALAATPSTGRHLPVTGSVDFQAVLDSSKAGDVIELQCGAVIPNNYLVRAKAGADSLHWITVRPSCFASLPAEGTRISPSVALAANLPKLLAPAADPSFFFAPGAAYYRFIGLDVSVISTATLNFGIIRVGESGTAQDELAKVPHHIYFDRMYVHGPDSTNVQRCFAFNGAWLALVDSYVSGCHYRGADAQAVGGWNGPGPFKIVNDYLEASGENILFGGADPSIKYLVPSDFEVRFNHLYKPLAWKGSVWVIKNLFECKNCQRGLIEANVLENNWEAGQSGHAILTQALTDANTAPWTTTKDLTFRLNIIRNAPICYDMLSRVAYGTNNTVPLMPDSASRRITFTNNLCDHVGSGSSGSGFGVFGDFRHVHVTHNTVLAIGNAMLVLDGDPMTGFVFADNLTGHGTYGIKGNGLNEGNPSLAQYAPGAVVRGNVLVAFPSSLYPSGNYFPATLADVGLAADLSLSATSPYKAKATDGKDPGADVPAILAATRGVVQATALTASRPAKPRSAPRIPIRKPE